MVLNLLTVKFALDYIKFLKRVRKIWYSDFSFDELVKYLDIPYLACNCETFFIHSSLCVIIIHSIKWKISRIWKLMLGKQQKTNNHNSSSSFTSFAMDCYSCIFSARMIRKFALGLRCLIKRFVFVMLCQKELCVNAKVKYCPKSTNIVIRKRKTLELKMRHLLACILFAFFNAKIINFDLFRQFLI